MSSSKLTPIKIAGKNKRDRSNAAQSARKKQKLKPSQQQQHPYKFTPSLSSSKNSSALTSRSTTPHTPIPSHRNKQNPLKSRSKPARKPKLSLLETLPVEILQRIFTFCYNFELPRASHIIRDKLSHEYVYQKSIVHAFEPSWTQSLAGLGQEFGASIGEKRRITITEGDPILQTKILRCRWATLPVLIAAQQRWLSDNLQPPQLTKPPTNPPPILNLDFATSAHPNSDILQDFDFNTFLEPDTESSPPPPSSLFFQPATILPTYNESASFQTAHLALQTTLEILLTTPATSHLPSLPSISLHPHLRIHPSTQLPPSLLTGPWTPSSKGHLHFLLRYDPRLEWVSSTDSEMVSVGLREALQKKDLETLILLDTLEIGMLIDEKLCVDFIGGGLDSGMNVKDYKSDVETSKENHNDHNDMITDSDTKNDKVARVKALMVAQLFKMLQRGNHLGSLDRARITRGVAFEAWRVRKESVVGRKIWEILDAWFELRRYLKGKGVHGR